MSDFFGIGNFLGSLVGAGAQAITSANNLRHQQDVFNHQKQVDQRNFDYMVQTQKEQWAREDSSIQRAVADAEAAGFSPLAALGNGVTTQPIAPSSQPNWVTPQYDGSFLSDVGSSIDRMRSNEKIADNKNETELMITSANNLSALERITMSVDNENKRFYSNLSHLQSVFAHAVTKDNKEFGFTLAKASYEHISQMTGGEFNVRIVPEDKVNSAFTNYLWDQAFYISPLVEDALVSTDGATSAGSIGADVFGAGAGSAGKVGTGVNTSLSTGSFTHRDRTKNFEAKMREFYLKNPYPITQKTYDELVKNGFKVNVYE